jgi:hypothetical protein
MDCRSVRCWNFGLDLLNAVKHDRKEEDAAEHDACGQRKCSEE